MRDVVRSFAVEIGVLRHQPPLQVKNKNTKYMRVIFREREARNKHRLVHGAQHTTHACSCEGSSAAPVAEPNLFFTLPNSSFLGQVFLFRNLKLDFPSSPRYFLGSRRGIPTHVENVFRLVFQGGSESLPRMIARSIQSPAHRTDMGGRVVLRVITPLRHP